jgi:hypothetical protein
MIDHVVDKPNGSGPCARRVVIATLYAQDGSSYQSSNWCMRPQPVCPRAHMPSGEGYWMCRDICKQKGHAETNALEIAGDQAKGSLMVVENHYRICDHCRASAAAAGVEKLTLRSV